MHYLLASLPEIGETLVFYEDDTSYAGTVEDVIDLGDGKFEIVVDRMPKGFSFSYESPDDHQ